jgi:predicted phage terminase large subunit-like protein
MYREGGGRYRYRCLAPGGGSCTWAAEEERQRTGARPHRRTAALAHRRYRYMYMGARPRLRLRLPLHPCYPLGSMSPSGRPRRLPSPSARRSSAAAEVRPSRLHPKGESPLPHIIQRAADAEARAAADEGERTPRAILEQLLEEMETRAMEQARGGLRLFIERAWAVLEPATPFVPGFHIDAIADLLSAITNGQVLNALLLIPPRFAKSLSAAVFWPAYHWGPANKPSSKWIFNTYRLDLSLRDSGKRRILMGHPWYQRRWGSRFTLGTERFRADNSAKYENDRSGYHLSTSVGGGNTGEGANVLVFDDCNNIAEIYSEIARENVIRWFNEVMATRRNDALAARLVVQQRGHERDLAGALLQQGGWDVLCLPNEYDPKRRCVLPAIGFVDPRTEPGELLCPARVSADQTAQLRTALGEQAYSAQFQQLAVPAEGGIWKRAWWRYWVPPLHPLAGTLDENGRPILTLPRRFDRRIHTWDMTFKRTTSGSYVCGMAWGKWKTLAFLLDRYRERASFTESLDAVRDLSRRYPTQAVYVEGKANGDAVLDVLRLEIEGLIESKTERGKEEYAHAASPHVQAGNYVLPHPSLFPWMPDMLARLTFFPNAQYDDEVDTITQADRQLFIQQPFDDRRFVQGSDHGI